jgi:hypothetical protein
MPSHGPKTNAFGEAKEGGALHLKKKKRKSVVYLKRECVVFSRRKKMLFVATVLFLFGFQQGF